MSDATQVVWTGQSGNKYTYWVHQIGAAFKDSPGNYIYAKKAATGGWIACYIGQTNSLATRLADHEKEGCAKRNGATHIHAHTSGSEASRLAEEKDLIVRWKPPCNEQHV